MNKLIKTLLNNKTTVTAQEWQEANIKQAIENYRVELGGHTPEFPYMEGCSCETHAMSLSDDGNIDDAVNRFIKAYLGDIKGRYSKSVKAITKIIAKELSKIGQGASLEMVQDSILYHLYRNWNATFTSGASKDINKWISTAYDTFRKDKGIFGTKAGEVPKGTYSTVDFRAIQYYKDNDKFYLGKFITDDDLKKKITAYIKDKYILNNMPIGNNEDAIADFKDEFGDILEGQDWKLRRIIDTTVSKMRNTAAVNYFGQAQVEEYEIVGVNDRLQPPLS